MKKTIALMLLFCGLYGLANAQVCKISDEGDNVEVFSAHIEDGNTVVVTLGNDSQNNSANVTVKAEVVYCFEQNTSNTSKYSCEGKVIAQPNQESVLRIRIPEKDKNGRIPKSVKVTSISGTKCK